MSATDEREFRRRMRQISELVAAVEACRDAPVREAARELVRGLLDLHAAGLAKMLHLAAPPGAPADELLDLWGSDDLVRSVLLLHGLHPVPIADRVAEARDRVCATLRVPTDAVELLEATAAEVRLRLRGDPCAGLALRHALEDALGEAAPDAFAIAFEEAWDRPPSGRIALPLLGNEAR
jgi:hypothetical protein